MAIYLLSPASHADAGDGVYAGFQYGTATYKEGDTADLEPSVGILRLGKSRGSGPGLEIRLGLGLSADDSRPYSDPSEKVEAEIDSLLGGYLVAPFASTGSASFYGAVGVTSVDVTTTGTVGSFSSSMSSRETGFSFGIGVNYEVFDSTQITFEYMSYLNGDKFDVDALSIGLLF
ncbi:MAG: outer membrane beta-barrel protein [Gammaproteobacteria bacterium]|jgi:opacity protein-like surface antigen